MLFDIEATACFHDTCPECETVAKWPREDDPDAESSLQFDQGCSVHGFTMECDNCEATWEVFVTATVLRGATY